MKVHYKQIDILKGIAILMVIMGHAIIVYPIDLNAQYPWCNYLHHFVSATHMPLFFAISGFCFSFHDWKLYLIKKSKRILIPLVVFGILGVFINVFLSSFVNDPNSPTDALIGILTGSSNWFLYTLFLIFLVFPFIRNAFDSQRLAFFLIGLFGILQLFNFWPSIFNIDNLVKYIFYFSIGYYFKVLSKEKPEACSKLVGVVDRPIVWAVSLTIWCGLVFVLIKWVSGIYALKALVSIIAAFAGVINIISFSRFISKFAFSKLFEETGKVSLQLFLFNGYFLTITRTVTVRFLHIDSPVLIIAANVFMMYFVSFILINFIVKKVKLFRVLTGMV